MGTIVKLFGLLPEALEPEISFKIVSGLCYVVCGLGGSGGAVVTAVGCDHSCGHSDHSCQTHMLCVQ